MSPHVTHESRGRHLGLLFDPRPIDLVFPRVRNGEVRDAKACHVVEEMGALAGVGSHVWKRGLDNHLCARELTPDNGNTEPRIGASPPAESYEHIRPSFLD